MSVELQALLAMVALLFLSYLMQAMLTGLNQGGRYGLGSRDEPPSNFTKLQGRVERTVRNHLEAMALFVPLVLIIAVESLSSPITQKGAVLFVAARAVFALLYALGIPYIRTIVWVVGIAGLCMMAWGILHPGV